MMENELIGCRDSSRVLFGSGRMVWGWGGSGRAAFYPPLVHWLPRAGGENAARPLPPHSSTMRRVTALYFDFSSPSVFSILLLTSPSMMIFQASGFFVSWGICPLLRM